MYRALGVAALLGASTNWPVEAQVAPAPHAEAGFLAKLNTVDHNVHWIANGSRGIIAVTTYGPCATLYQMAPTQIGVKTGDGYGPIILYPTWERAAQAARRYCDAWFTQTKASRTAMAEINAQWQRDHPRSTDDSFPRMVKGVNPEFPEEARRRKVPGQVVTVHLTVDEVVN